MMKTIQTVFLASFCLFFLSATQIIAQNDPPTANCKGNALVTPLFEGESRTIHAEIFDKNSFDDNTPSEDLRFSFSSDPADSLYQVDCNTIDSFEFQLYVFDEEGEMDSCSAKLNIDDQCNNQPTINGSADTEAPTIYLTDQMALTALDSVSFNTIQAKDFNAGTFDNVNSFSELRFTFSPDPNDTTFTYHCDDQNSFNLTVYVADEAGNQSFCDVSISIDTSNCDDAFFQDTIPPAVSCISTLEKNLDTEGQASISTMEVDDGTVDGNAITPVERLRFSFDLQNPMDSTLELGCEDIGESERQLYVWDHEGNLDSCTFTLTVNDPTDACQVVDTIAPEAECNALIEFSLEGDTTYTFTASELDNGSTDNVSSAEDLYFSFSTDTLDNEMSLSCENLGNNEVVLYVTDEAGNQSTCTSVVELTDPEGLCENVSITSLEQVQWNIYPNPFNSEFTIENLPVQKGDIHLTIYDMQGKEVHSQFIRESSPRIHAGISAGNYILKLSQKGKVIGLHKLSRK